MDQVSSEADVACAVVTDICHLRIPGHPDWIEPTINFCIRRGTEIGAIEPSQANRLSVALHEGLTNSIIHGNLGDILRIKGKRRRSLRRGRHGPLRRSFLRFAPGGLAHGLRRSSLAWVLTDQGNGFDTQTALKRLEEEPDLLKPSGRGLLLIQAFVNEMHMKRAGGVWC